MGGQQRQGPTRLVAGMIGLLLIIPLAGLVPAAADTTCANGKVCLWENSSFGGCKLVRDASDSTFVDNDPCGFGGDGFNDDTSSAKNQKNHATVLCGSINWSGGISANLAANTVYAQVPNNDTASSYWDGVINC